MTKHKKGSVFGGMLLIAGSCIGAGMLGLPIITGFAGFFPSMIMFVVAWAFMTLTGLFLVEVNGWFHNTAHLTTMVEKTLGRVAKVITLFLFLFLFYALLVAYVAASGHHFSNVFQGKLPVWAGSTFFVLVFGVIVYLGTYAVDMTNRWLMLGKIISYIALVAIGLSYVDPEKLLYSSPKYSLFPLPILIISFGFQNMIPSLNRYFEGNTKKVKSSILGGSILALVIYIIWEVVALGILPTSGKVSIAQGFSEGIDAAQVLKMYLHNSPIGDFAFFLAFFAILTSFLAQALSLVHFLADGFKIEPTRKEQVALCLLALVPPLLFAIGYPDIFFKALNFAGGICAVVLFGIFPAAMVYQGRYIHKHPSSYQVKGGKPLIYLIGLFAFLVFLNQLLTILGCSLFPSPL
jgi:tyrosine-specific transport protein